jgi:hypothetical protein
MGDNLFGDGGIPEVVTLDQQIAEVRREIQMRRSVYPSLVARGKLTERERARREQRLEAVLVTLQNLKGAS